MGGCIGLNRNNSENDIDTSSVNVSRQTTGECLHALLELVLIFILFYVKHTTSIFFCIRYRLHCYRRLKLVKATWRGLVKRFLQKYAILPSSSSLVILIHLLLSLLLFTSFVSHTFHIIYYHHINLCNYATYPPSYRNV